MLLYDLLREETHLKKTEYPSTDSREVQQLHFAEKKKSITLFKTFALHVEYTILVLFCQELDVSLFPLSIIKE